MFYVYISLGIIALFVTLGVIGERQRRKKIEKVFENRQELDERDFYERYFESKDVPFYIIKKIREILEEVLEADLSRLSAEDDFSKNLNFFWQEDSMADVEIFEKIEEEFEIKFHQSDFDNLQTTSVNDIVNIVWQKVKDKNESEN